MFKKKKKKKKAQVNKRDKQQKVEYSSFIHFQKKSNSIILPLQTVSLYNLKNSNYFTEFLKNTSKTK